MCLLRFLRLELIFESLQHPPVSWARCKLTSLACSGKCDMAPATAGGYRSACNFNLLLFVRERWGAVWSGRIYYLSLRLP